MRDRHRKGISIPYFPRMTIRRWILTVAIAALFFKTVSVFPQTTILLAIPLIPFAVFLTMVVLAR